MKKKGLISLRTFNLESFESFEMILFQGQEVESKLPSVSWPYLGQNLLSLAVGLKVSSSVPDS